MLPAQEQRVVLKISTTRFLFPSTSSQAHDHGLGELEMSTYHVDPDEQSVDSIQDFSVPKAVGVLACVCVLGLCVACCFVWCFVRRVGQPHKRRVHPENPPDHKFEVQEKGLPTLMCPREQPVLPTLLQSSKISGVANGLSPKVAQAKPALPPIVVRAPVKLATAPHPIV